jgi:benzaldehyde dehydrogenase (NAD)
VTTSPPPDLGNPTRRGRPRGRLSLGILTKDVMRGLELARRIPTGIVHINEQTVDDEPNVPFGGIFDSGTGTRFGGTANLDAFTETRWVTIRGDIAPYPF